MNDFEKSVIDTGVPTTDAAIESAFKKIVVDQGSEIANTSAYSPFWRIVNALVVTPAAWIIRNLLIESVLPNLYVQTAKGTRLDLLGQGRNVTRKPPVKALGLIEFTRLDSSSELDIEAGTVITTPTINGIFYKLITTVKTRFEIGVSVLLAPVEAMTTGTAHNLAGGYYTLLETAVNGVDSVTNLDTWLLTPGAETESDDDYRERIRNQFGTISTFHVDSIYRSILSAFPAIRSENIYFEHNAPRGDGTANAYIMLDVGNPSAAFIDELNDHVGPNGNGGYHGHGDDLLVIAMPETQHDIVLDVWLVKNLSVVEVSETLNNIDQFVRAAFRENQAFQPSLTYPRQLFSFSVLTRELHNQFANIQTLAFNNSDIFSNLELARINTLLVTDNA